MAPLGLLCLLAAPANGDDLLYEMHAAPPCIYFFASNLRLTAPGIGQMRDRFMENPKVWLSVFLSCFKIEATDKKKL